jgi:hypothetical protein
MTGNIVTLLERLRAATKSTNESLEISISNGREYLLSTEDTGNAWGITKDSLKGSLYAYKALYAQKSAEYRETFINMIVSLQQPNGSIYDSAEITGLIVNLLTAPEPEETHPIENKQIIDDIELYTYVNGEKADIISFTAYTDIYFNPILSGYDENSMDALLMIMQPDARLTPVEYSSGTEAVWNTTNHVPGRYTLYVIIIDKTTGYAIDIKDKQFYISEGFELQEAYLTITPRSFRINSNDTVKIASSLFANTNIPKTLTIGITVTDESENVIIFNTQRTHDFAFENSFASLPAIEFKPESIELGKYTVTAEISDENGTLMTVHKTLEVLPPAPETRIDIDYELSKDTLLPGEDTVSLTFNITGVGVGENLRSPIDLVLLLDDSLSMTGVPLTQTKAAAIEIVNQMQPEDRCALVHWRCLN